jgi:hypothetical protein
MTTTTTTRYPPLLHVRLGFSTLDCCSRCARTGPTAWLNAEHPYTSTTTPAISLYLCRDCAIELLGRTYGPEPIDWQDARRREQTPTSDPGSEVRYFPNGGCAEVVGLHFHTFGPDGVLHYQGRVLRELRGGRYRVQLYSFLDGHETDRKDVDAGDMSAWVFYPNDRVMRWAYANYLQAGHFRALEAHS